MIALSRCKGLKCAWGLGETYVSSKQSITIFFRDLNIIIIKNLVDQINCIAYLLYDVHDELLTSK